MTGSWAGAMGQTQFMPSSYLKHAVDFDKDGKSDIWQSTADALASIASYLKAYGWDGTYTWGREVSMTPAVRARIADARAQAHRRLLRAPQHDRAAAARRVARDGRHARGRRPAAEVRSVPAGLVDVGERLFLVYPNYDAILGYNCAHYYALSVALLADELK